MAKVTLCPFKAQTPRDLAAPLCSRGEPGTIEEDRHPETYVVREPKLAIWRGHVKDT